MTSPVRAGDLRDRISIIRDTSATTASGGKRLWNTYATVASLWAAVQPVQGGSEEFAAGDAVAASVVRYGIWIRRRTDLKPKMRLLFGTRQLDIVAMPLAGTGEPFMKLVCEEVLK